MVENCVNIRLHTQADFKFLSSFFRDPLIIKENAGGSVLPEEKIAEFCNRSEENCKQQQCWMFTVLDEKTPVGCCLVRKNAKYGGFEIGFGILETYRGCGQHVGGVPVGISSCWQRSDSLCQSIYICEIRDKVSRV